MKINFKYVAFGVIAAVAVAFSGSLVEDVDAGEVVVIQYPVTGNMKVVTEPGLCWQGGGKATHYKRENQFTFLSSEDKIRAGMKDTTNNAVRAIWNDGGKSSISGSIRWTMPTDVKSVIKLHSNYGSQEQIEFSLIKTNVEKSVFLTGPIMSSKESYAEKRGDLISLIEDQANNGVYKTRTVEREVVDELTNEKKNQSFVEVVEKNGVQQRQEISTAKTYGINIYNVTVNSISYDHTVEKQITTQQQAIMAVQTAISNSKKAEQDAITAQKQGEAEATKAKWEIEVTKARQVTEAQARTAVAVEAVKAAELNKQAAILEGQGEAEKKRLIMNADGALDKKLEAYVKTQANWAKAFSDYQGALVPQTVMGGGSGGNAAVNFMEIMGMKAAKDLSLDVTARKK